MQPPPKRHFLSRVVAAAAATGFAAGCGGPAPRVGPASAPPVPTILTASPTPATLLRPPITYVAIGASDTAGVGVEDPEHEAWVNVLAQTLPQPVTVVNLGISGATARDAVEQELPPAVSANPNLITIWLVVNDLLAGVPLDAYRNALGQLLGDLHTRTEAQVAVGNAPDPSADFDYLQVPGMPAAQRQAAIQAWNAAIADVVNQRGAILVDIFSRWPVAQHPDYIGPDHFHPSAAGYHALADVFRQTLAERHLV